MKRVILLLLLCGLARPGYSQIIYHSRISDTEGGFSGFLDDGDSFGTDISAIGDLDGNGFVDLAVGARHDDDGGLNRGAVWILFLGERGNVVGESKISAVEGGLVGQLDDNDLFGSRVEAVGDVNNDGKIELAVGARGDDDGGQDRGAVWILSLDSDGTVASEQKISSTSGGFSGALQGADNFGQGVSSLGDLNGDGIPDMAVGAYADDDGGFDRGAVWVLFLNPDGSVQNRQKISDTQGDFGGELTDMDYFGSGVSKLGDVDGDGVTDIVVGASGDGASGALWVLFLRADGTVKGYRKITSAEGGAVEAFQSLGIGIGGVGDLDSDGIPDIMAGDPGLDTGGNNSGGIWVLFLNADGSVKSTDLIDTEDLAGELSADDPFPSAVKALGDLDGDGRMDFGAGHTNNDDGGQNRGAVWLLFGSYANPQQVLLSHPLKGATGITLDPVLRWQSVSGATSYALTVDDNSDLQTPLVSEVGLIATEFQLVDLSLETQYFWRVQADSPGGVGPWSATWDFTTTSFALSAPVPLYPTDGLAGVRTDPTLTWTAIAGATSYDLMVSKSSAFSPSVVDEQGLPYTSLSIGPLDPLRSYYWRVRAQNASGVSEWSGTSFFSTGSGVDVSADDLPTDFALTQNYPNPFNPKTRISYELPRAIDVTLTVVDLLGREVQLLASGTKAAGVHEVSFDATGFLSGVYFYHLQAGAYTETRKMVLLK